MEKQTLVFTALPNGFTPDGTARVSVLVSPRLWADPPPAGILTLAAYPDLLAWPARVAALDWKASLDGGPDLALAPEVDARKPELWAALFQATTRVKPFVFEDHRGTPVESFPWLTIQGMMAGLYGRASSDPAYGAGSERPGLGVLAADPDLAAIARPSFPEPEPEWQPVETAPVPFPDAPRPPAIVTPVPQPEPPEPEPEPQGCGCGCLGWPLALLRRIFGGGKKGTGGKGASAPVPVDPPSSKPAPTPSFSTEVTPPAPPPPPAPGKTFLPPPLTPAQQQVRDAFDALDAFLKPYAGGRELLPTAAQVAESWDFHQAVSALGDFPEVLRWLGLVVDLLLPAGTALPAAGTIRLSASGVAWQPGTKVVAPRTHFVSSATLFTAAPRPVQPEISNGFLRVDDTARFRVIQNDVPGDAVKLRNAATHFLRFAKLEDRPGNLPGEGGLPGLRTTGLSLVRGDAAAELAAQFQRSCALNRFLASQDGSPEPEPAGAAGPAPLPSDELFAEDLVRGYRIDVLDTKTGVWRSLCERTGTYRFLEAAGGPVEESAVDEGFVQFAATAPADPTAPKSLRTGESLFTWNGWSLAAPRPGKAILPDDTHADPPNTAATPFRVETEFRAKPFSLPRLRFGRRYRLRARVADLAGNSVLSPDDGAAFEVDAPGLNPETPELTAVRYEPLAPPVLMLRQAPVEGESVERLVVRTPAIGGLGTLTERHVAPPKTSQLMAELHGGFDGAAVDGSPAGYALAGRESKSAKDGAVQTRPAVDGNPGVIPPAPADSDPWIQPDPFLSVQYLPDPQARGAAFTGLPGEPSPGTVRRVTFGNAWPDLKAFRIALAIPTGPVANPPAWSVAPADPTTGVLTVELAPAERATVRVNSVLDAADLDSRGVWEWTDEMGPANLATVKASVLGGSHWAHLPWRELTLVHAVQKPLAAPAIVTLDLAKALGKTFTTVADGDVDVDAPSTGRVQLLAEWTDPVDDPNDLTAPVPAPRTQSAHVCEVEVPEGVDPVSLKAGAGKPPWKHELHDTKYHRVEYTPVAVTRFREYFPASTNTPGATTEAGAAFPVEVPSSARPDAPRVLYIVPVFDWDTPPGAAGVTKRVRTGGGLRVYLERPWYSSGDGELLGVVFLDSTDFLKLDDHLKPFVTQWGADPVWEGTPTWAAAMAAHFLGSTKSSPSPVSLEENPTPVSVAGYAPSFDAERNLWYADVRIDAGDAYWPFVRLALARYQPTSVPDAHLSRVTRTDFVQVPPRREAEITVTAPTVQVKVSGPVYVGSEVTQTIGSTLPFVGGSPGSNGLSEVEALIELRDAGDDPANELAWKPIEATRILFFQNPAAPGVWQGSVTLDRPLLPGLFRLTLRESEWFRTDDAGSTDAPRDRLRVARRVVYADVFAL